MSNHPLKNVLMLAGAGLVLTACADESPTVAEAERAAVQASAAEASAPSQSQIAQALSDLRRRTAAWHNADKAEEAGYTLNIGCVDERILSGDRGMGYHVTIPPTGPGMPPPLLADDAVSLLEPEFLVYEIQEGSGELKFSAFDYFIPASEKWPAPEDGGVPPVLDELGMDFHWSPPHNGWMFHIWLWSHNPDGMFSDFSPSVSLCDCEQSTDDVAPCTGPAAES